MHKHKAGAEAERMLGYLRSAAARMALAESDLAEACLSEGADREAIHRIMEAVRAETVGVRELFRRAKADASAE